MRRHWIGSSPGIECLLLILGTSLGCQELDPALGVGDASPLADAATTDGEPGPRPGRDAAFVADARALADAVGGDAIGVDHGETDAGSARSDSGSNPPAGDAGNVQPPDPVSPGGPAWFLHITDTHFGSGTGGQQLTLALLDEVVPVVQPDAVIHTGDVTENGSYVWAWSAYWDTIDAKAAPYPRWIEIPGNHDVKDDGEPNFLAHTRAGRAGAGPHGHAFIETARGRVRLLRTNTADSSNNFTNIAGIFGADQKDALLSAPEAAEPVAFTLILAHHPLVGAAGLRLGSDDRMKELFTRFSPPLYLCGHVHSPALAWVGSTLSVQGNTFGKDGVDSSFMLASVDDNGPRVREVPMHASRSPALEWPLVMISAPADRGLARENPHATALPRGSVRVRALAFAPSGMLTAEARIDQGAWLTMSALGRGAYEAVVTGTLSGGAHRVEVRATGPDGQKSDVIDVELQ